MLATPNAPSTELLSPSDLLASINADRETLEQQLILYCGTDIYTDLKQFAFSEGQDLKAVYRDRPLTKLQLRYWLKSRTEKIRGHVKTLADPKDLERRFTQPSRYSSILFFNIASIYPHYTCSLTQQLEAMSEHKSREGEIRDWLAELRSYVEQLVSDNQKQICQTQEESTHLLDSRTEKIEALPESLSADQFLPLLEQTQKAISKEMEVVVLEFMSRLYFDLSAKSHDYFLNKNPNETLKQSILPAVSEWSDNA